jgi:hypothetical protein
MCIHLSQSQLEACSAPFVKGGRCTEVRYQVKKLREGFGIAGLEGVDPPTMAEVGQLLGIEDINGFGIMAPSTTQVGITLQSLLTKDINGFGNMAPSTTQVGITLHSLNGINVQIIVAKSGGELIGFSCP